MDGFDPATGPIGTGDIIGQMAGQSAEMTYQAGSIIAAERLDFDLDEKVARYDMQSLNRIYESMTGKD